MTEFRSRAVRSLAELHRVELLSCFETWKRFKASGKPMPEAKGDADYETPERLAAHVQGAARGYIIWMAEQVGRPITEIQRAQSWEDVWADFDGFAEKTLAAWEKHGALLTDEELGPTMHKTRWGDMITVETMLEHAVVHPMRHRIQLERALA
jgi:hypothetical protein